jgi:plasmid stability protein
MGGMKAMSNILVRDVDTKIVNRLKTIAKQHGRSLQSEIKAILTEAASFLASEAATVSVKWHKTLSGRELSDSAALVREDRNR